MHVLRRDERTSVKHTYPISRACPLRIYPPLTAPGYIVTPSSLITPDLVSIVPQGCGGHRAAPVSGGRRWLGDASQCLCALVGCPLRSPAGDARFSDGLTTVLGDPAILHPMALE